MSGKNKDVLVLGKKIKSDTAHRGGENPST